MNKAHKNLANQKSGYVVIRTISGLRIAKGFVQTIGHNGTDEVIVVHGMYDCDVTMHPTLEDAEKELFHRKLKGEE